MTGMTLTEACDDPHVLGLTLWPLQERMADAYDTGASLIAAMCGRRAGKTTLTAAMLVHDATMRPECDEHVRDGETRYSVIYAPRLDQARLIVSMARSMVERSPVLRAYLQPSTEDELRFERNGKRTAILALPCSSRAGRGLPTSCVLFDEYAHFITDTEGPAAAQRVWAAASPGLAQFGALGRAVMISTPLGPDNPFARMHAKAEAGEIPGAVALHATTLEANPTISASWVDAQRKVLSPVEFGSEFEADPSRSAGGFVDDDQYEPVDTSGLTVDSVVIGLDPGQRDGFGFAVVGAVLDGPPPRLAAVRTGVLDRPEMTSNVDLVLALTRGYRDALVVTDQHAAAMIAERLRAGGVRVRVAPWAATTGPKATGKFEAYADMRTRLYEGRLVVPDDAALLAELGALRVKASGSAWRVESPRRKGSHGDRASALALAVAHCHEPPERIGWLSEDERQAREVAEVRQRIAAAHARSRGRMEDVLGPMPGPATDGPITGGLMDTPW